MNGQEVELIKVGINAGSLGLNFLIIILMYRFIDKHTPKALEIFNEAVNKKTKVSPDDASEKEKKV